MWLYVKNALFYFPYSLFGGDAALTKPGVTDLGRLPETIEKHKSSAKRLRNMIDLAMLGKVNIANQLSEACRSSKNKHNNKIGRNTHTVKNNYFIKFCGISELSLCRHDESSDSANPRVFRMLLDISGKLDDNLNAILKLLLCSKETPRQSKRNRKIKFWKFAELK
jgi:hypothetical protein